MPFLLKANSKTLKLLNVSSLDECYNEIQFAEISLIMSIIIRSEISNKADDFAEYN